jgi:hypothetical protein
MKFSSLVLLVSLLNISSAIASTASLKVKTFTDYSNSHQNLCAAKTFNVDSAFAEKYNLEFYMFYRGQDEICFSGSEVEAEKIVDVILNAATGDAYVYPDAAKITKNQIIQHVRFEDEGGEHSFTLKLSRCP